MTSLDEFRADFKARFKAENGSMRVVVVIVSLFGAAAFAFGAYRGLFYVTGDQFYRACWERSAAQQAIGGFKEPQAKDPDQAALWASCTPIVARAWDKAGFAFSSPDPNAPPEARALVGACPNRDTEVPAFLDYMYLVPIDLIEQSGGPSLIDSVLPADFLIKRVLRARWPHCARAAQPYRVAARNH
jgi:hypothetical protein